MNSVEDEIRNIIVSKMASEMKWRANGNPQDVSNAVSLRNTPAVRDGITEFLRSEYQADWGSQWSDLAQ